LVTSSESSIIYYYDNTNVFRKIEAKMRNFYNSLSEKNRRRQFHEGDAEIVNYEDYH